ncbi:MAG: branched-chain amino acid ABC transporter permease [Beijerinckiaceae bacterium]|nr:branched-chain amino acid ABC transporter permease [Beijerinckiaceae bacterium]
MDEPRTPAVTKDAKPPRWRAWAPYAGLLALVALPFAAQALGQAALTTLATRMVILAIAASALNIALGLGGLVSFGHAAFYGVGAYAVGILTTHGASGAPFLGFIPGSELLGVNLLAAMLASGLVAGAIGALALRTSGVQFIMITLAFAQMLFFFFVALKAYGGDDGVSMRRRNALPGLNMRDDMTFYFVSLAILAVWLGISARLFHSRFGLLLGGIRQSERRMQAIGVSTVRTRWLAFVLSGMGTGLAGGLMAVFGRFVSPDMMHWTQSGELLIMVVLGGAGTIFGPVLGAFALIGLETLLAGWTEHWQVILGPALVLMALTFRGGLARLGRRREGP